MKEFSQPSTGGRANACRFNCIESDRTSSSVLLLAAITPTLLDEAHNVVGKAIHVDGLGDIPITSCIQGALFVALHDISCQRDDGNIVKLWHLADVVGGSVAILAGHVDVHQNQ